MTNVTLWSILTNEIANFEARRGIIIPMVQRDYAQGRLTTKAGIIRKLFLEKIRAGIEKTKLRGEPPMELDFVYGYAENQAFVPLDGQQRLTTLFLLHWYFAFKEHKIEVYIQPFSRFGYETRSSSKEFFEKLIVGLSLKDYDLIFTKGWSFEKVITNKNWYFVSWKYDLTISSVITMLDEIHNIFNSSAITFSDLISESDPPIVFSFLNVSEMGLTDDLYIKMNARGKQLTNFENLKAELSRLIENSDFNENYNYKITHNSGETVVTVEKYFATKIDTAWTDYFWKLRNKTTDQFDDKLLNLLAFVALNRKASSQKEDFDYCLTELQKTGNYLSFYHFEKLELLDEPTVISYIDTLDILTDSDPDTKIYLHTNTFLEKKNIISAAFRNDFGSRYEDRALFYGVFEFFKAHGTTSVAELRRWDRLVRNLVFNTYFNSYKIFSDCLQCIGDVVANYTDNIYETILNTNLKGFDSQQIIEEKIKIKLICKSDSWEKIILEAEAQPYLKGQIIFLLAFTGIYERYFEKELTWIDDIDDLVLADFLEYFNKFQLNFDDKGLRDFENEEFRRALLSKGDYLVYSTNWSFLINNHRDISWKRLLRETGNRTSDFYQKRSQYLLELFDDIDPNNLIGSLKMLINNYATQDWKRDFIKNPILIKRCYQYYIKWYDNPENIYLLRKSKYNRSEDPEVKSVLLKDALKKVGFEDADIGLGFIETLNQYGIIRIKAYKPKVAYNYNGEENYLIRQKGKDDFVTSSFKKMFEYIRDNF